MAHLPFPGWGGYPFDGLDADVVAFFRDSSDIYVTWIQVPMVLRMRYDNLVARLYGRHPNDVHPENWPIVIDIWRERWNILQLWAPDEPEAFEPPVPEIQDLRAP